LYRRAERRRASDIEDVTELIDDSTHYHNRYRLHDSETGSTFTDLLEINTLELPKLPAESDQSALWDWLRFIKVEKESEMEALARKNPQIRKAVGALRIMSADERERERALNHQRDLMAAHGRLEYAKAEGIEIGKSEGIEIGKSEGIEIGKNEGIQIGKNEGIQIGKNEGIEIGEQRGEHAKAVAVARKLKEKSLPPGEIAEISGLPADEIERL
jgi:predicted transposase/invertase (TIGR01784 family)